MFMKNFAYNLLVKLMLPGKMIKDGQNIYTHFSAVSSNTVQFSRKGFS